MTQPPTPSRSGNGVVPLSPPEREHWLAVASGKGGTGKTHVAASLASTWSQQGDRVLLVDSDLGLGNVEMLLGLRPKFDLGDVLSGAASVDDAMVAGPAGVQVLVARSGCPELVQLGPADRARLAAALTRAGRDFDHVIVDIGAGIGAQALFFQGLAARTLLVTSSEPPALTDAYAFIKVANRVNGTPHYAVAVNQVRGAGEGAHASRILGDLAQRFLGVGVSLAGEIPYDAAVTRAVRAQRTVVDSEPGAVSARALTRLARALLFPQADVSTSSR